MKRAVLIVSFGSSNLDAYKQVESFIKNIKDSIDKELFIQCVFTSNILIKRMKEKNNIDILNVKEALEILFNDGYKEVILQPLHMIDGKDCDSLRNILEENKDRFNYIKLNPTLLINKGKNTKESALNIANAIKDNVNKDRCVVLVGHGSNRCQDNCCYTSIGINQCCGDNGNVCNDDCYQEIEKALQSIGYKNVIIGTLEGSRTRSVVLKELKDKKIDDVIIMPLLVLPGNHIIKDIKGDNSWESLFNENDINVEVNLKSLLEYEKIQKLYIDMINEAINVE
ncbi:MULTISPECIES: sirohydrochlorin cobaltochelatase [Clostridium]|uniref:Sirohydrochlorin cobaltochelatase n=1 Tax=Clostridium disporicum TaxID=84024 RepID=A0A174HJR9_9CLOT|nr:MULTISPECIES: sirohydrochlorin cobaltochelatase [Clostridium]MCD2502174.1 sirohydrochlorin cobaltochelatase [Clostridium sp. NSJ-145]CUO73666.1 sirohydrochlorin cobaltochelatase [Clostridium disporicum]